jgi:hypothetical protein
MFTMPTQSMTIPQYAAKMKCSRQAVHKAIRLMEDKKKKQPLLSKVTSFEKVGKSYVLTVQV